MSDRKLLEEGVEASGTPPASNSLRAMGDITEGGSPAIAVQFPSKFGKSSWPRWGVLGLGVIGVITLVGWWNAAGEVAAAREEYVKTQVAIGRLAAANQHIDGNAPVVGGITAMVRMALERAGIPESACVGVLPQQGRGGAAEAALVELRGISIADLGRWLEALGVGSGAAWLIDDLQISTGLDRGTFTVTVRLVAPDGG